MRLPELKEQLLRGEISKDEYIHRTFAEHRSLFEYAAYLKHSDVAEILVRDGEVLVRTRTDGLLLRCDPEDMGTPALACLNFGRYEPDFTEFILRVVQEGATFLDVGANIGWYSLLVAKRFPRARVFAFEPIPRTFETLLQNVKLNGLSNVYAQNYGLYNRNVELEFFFEKDLSGRASAANLAGRTDIETVRLPVRRLDDLRPNLFSGVDLIKCDCEGCELFVFEGARRILKECQPVVIAEMLRKWAAKFNYHPNQILDLFAECGYRCFTLQTKRLMPFLTMDESVRDTNFVFLHPKKHERLLLDA